MKADVHRSGESRGSATGSVGFADIRLQGSTSLATHSRTKPRRKDSLRWRKGRDIRLSAYPTTWSGTLIRTRSAAILEGDQLIDPIFKSTNSPASRQTWGLGVSCQGYLITYIFFKAGYHEIYSVPMSYHHQSRRDHVQAFAASFYVCKNQPSSSEVPWTALNSVDSVGSYSGR